MKPTALIVDEDPDHSHALAAAVGRHGFNVEVFADVGDAERLDSSADVRVAFVTLRCGGEDGLRLLDHPAVSHADEIILMNATDEPALVNRGMAAGASYFFRKPFDARFIDSVLEDLEAEVSAGSRDAAADVTLDQFGLLRGDSPPMRKLYRIMRKVAHSDTSVLLIGESGTGKELVAQSLHMFSPRGHHPFVAMNCAAVPKELFESELFGHEKGSFSGAVRRHHGMFERADGGTLFLDEITEMPLELQAKLLRVLELGEFRRVGGEEDLSSDVRIVASTNRQPEAAIAENLLREDLYFRIARFPLWIPPLRERGSDIRGLVLFFLNQLNRENDSAITIHESALQELAAYAWPGNVRELKSVLERAFILANEEIEAEHLEGFDETAAAEMGYITVSATSSVDEAEKKLILAALDAHDGDKPATAKSLGVSLKTLYNRLNDYAQEGESVPGDANDPDAGAGSR